MASRWIKLTSADYMYEGDEVHIRSDSIILLSWDREQDHTIVILNGNWQIHVQETPEDIMKLIDQ